GPRLRRALLYPAELKTHLFDVTCCNAVAFFVPATLIIVSHILDNVNTIFKVFLFFRYLLIYFYNSAIKNPITAI
ncbi:hypothetical protein AB2T61_19900, partial [Clostridium butyricum]|uniref:hypothetical protein n=1 Tax=Clostridium butyricum TaxID=1492 RepID=UPI003467405A